ncbi:MAG: YkvA family protein [Huintestinicola sp.]
MDLKQKAFQLKKEIPAIFLALKHKETPVSAKILAAVTISYALSPIDLIPDFIPMLGYLDDIIILPSLAALTLKLIPDDILEQCRKDSENMWLNGKPKKWYYAVPIILIWLMIIWAIVKNNL